MEPGQRTSRELIHPVIPGVVSVPPFLSHLERQCLSRADRMTPARLSAEGI